MRSVPEVNYEVERSGRAATGARVFHEQFPHTVWEGQAAVPLSHPVRAAFSRQLAWNEVAAGRSAAGPTATGSGFHHPIATLKESYTGR